MTTTSNGDDELSLDEIPRLDVEAKHEMLAGLVFELCERQNELRADVDRLLSGVATCLEILDGQHRPGEVRKPEPPATV